MRNIPGRKRQAGMILGTLLMVSGFSLASEANTNDSLPNAVNAADSTLEKKVDAVIENINKADSVSNAEILQRVKEKMEKARKQPTESGKNTDS